MYYPNLIKEELESRLNTKVTIKEVENTKVKLNLQEEDIWENLDDLREWVSKNATSYIYEYVIQNKKVSSRHPDKEGIEQLQKQKKLIAYLRNLEKVGITEGLALKILANSKTKKKINEYKKYYGIIVLNRELQTANSKEASKTIMLNETLKPNRMQVAIFCYINDKGQKTFSVTEELQQSIIEYYQEQFPLDKKGIGKRQVVIKINAMYKLHSKVKLKSKNKKNKQCNRMGELRIDKRDIFEIVKSDYAK
jgi:hypothetical protein